MATNAGDEITQAGPTVIITTAAGKMADPNQCVSNVVFGFVVVLVMLFSIMGGGLLVWWVGSRKSRRLEAQAEKIQKERDALRDKEIQVHATATQHYLGEVNHWRKEFERMQSENDSYRKALEDAGINIPAAADLRRRTTMTETLVGSRPQSPEYRSRRDIPSLHGKLNYEKEG